MCEICGAEYQSCLERKESSRKNAPDIFRRFAVSLYLAEYYSVHVCEKSTRDWNKNSQKRMDRMILRKHTALEIIWFPPVRVEKPHDTYSIKFSIQRRLSQYRETTLAQA